MSDNRQLASDIRELDRGITDCEQFLAKVLNRKIESSRQAPANKKKNVPAKSSSRPQSRGGGAQILHRAPSAGASSTRGAAKQTNPTRKSVTVVHSQPRKVSADRLPKPKSSEGHQRRRSNSVSRLASQSCTCEPPSLESFNKLPMHVHVPRITASKVQDVQIPVKLESSSRAHRSRSPGSKNKNLSWGQILRENHQSCKADRGQWDIPGTRHATASHSSFSTKIPHECEPIKECSSSECTATASCNHFFKVTVPRRPQEESFSSEGTSGFSSNNELPSHLTNKSVQCGVPNPGVTHKSCLSDSYQHRRISSSSSGASSQKPEEKEKVVGVLGSDVFSIFNPVRTLNFLIKELQGLLQKHPQGDGSVWRVVRDLERVVLRLPQGEGDSSSGYTTPSTTSSSNEAVVAALRALPALAHTIHQRATHMRSKLVETKTQVPVPALAPAPPEVHASSNPEDVARLQKQVESSGQQLEQMCHAMEQACDVMRCERDTLQQKVEEREKRLQQAKSQEQDFVTSLTSLRTNLEATTRRATQLSLENRLLKEQLKELPNLKYMEEKCKQLSKENAKLKEENKELPALKDKDAKIAELTSSVESLQSEKKNLEDKVMKCNLELQKAKETSQNHVGVAEATKRLTQRLQETMRERDEAQHDAQMLRIEREKLLCLQQNKDEELSHFVQDIINIKALVAGQLNLLKSSVPPHMSPPDSLSDCLLNSSSESEELASVSQCQQPVCSSPTSTAPSGLGHADEVWQDVSTILPEQTHSSPEILLRHSPEHKAHDTNSPPDFKSIDAWPSGPAATPRPGPPEPQWTGAAAVAQELHHNVQELFNLINNKPLDVPSSGPVLAAPRGTNRNFQFQVPRLPDPPKFLETPELSDFSSYAGSLAEASSVESIDAVLKELQKGDRKHKEK